MVQSDAMHYSTGLWVQNASNLLPDAARQAHATYGGGRTGGRLVPLDEYIAALRKVVSAGSLADFGIEAEHGTIIVAQEFEGIDCDVAITDESVSKAMTL